MRLIKIIMLIIGMTCFILASSPAEGKERRHHQKVKKKIHRAKGHTIIWTALVGSKERLAYENELVSNYQLSRFQNFAEILEAIAKSELVVVPHVSKYFYIDVRFINGKNSQYNYLRPWTLSYLENLSHRFHDAFPNERVNLLAVTSMVRDLEYQKRLASRGTSGADCSTEDRCSSHLTGATFDISFRKISLIQKIWLGNELDKDNGKTIHAIYERRSGCFHIFVIPPEVLIEDSKDNVKPTPI